MSTQFVVDEKGEKVAAIIPIEEYYDLMEDLTDLAAIASQRNEEFVPLDDVIKKLFPDGLPSSALKEVGEVH